MSYISAAQAKQIAQRAVDNLKDGTLVPKLADNMTPYAKDSGTTQTQPFFLEGTATGNGESRVDAKQVPAYAFLQEKRGNMVCVNQLLNSADFPSTTTVNGITFTNNGDGTITVNGTATADAYIVVRNSNNAIPAGRSVLVCGCPAGGGNTTYYMYPTTTTGVAISGSKDTGSGVIAVSQTRDINGVFIFITNGTTVSNLVFRPKLVDLTQWFNGNIPAYLLSHPEAFGRYYKGPLSYEPGRLVPATGRYLTSVGRNLYDGEHDVEVSPSTRYYCSGLATITYKDVDGESISNETVAIDWFDTPSNCYSIGISTQIPSLTISLYYPGESGYDKYYHHEVLATIDTGTESLYSAGTAYDSKVPSGLIMRRIGSVDLGTLDWILAGGYSSGNFSVNIASKGFKSGGEILCAKYSLGDASVDKSIRIAATYIGIADSAYADAASFKTAMSGVMLYFELATPTTEQGTPFQENVPIDDFGQLSWSNTDVPQGNQIFYPVDYKAYEDTLIKYTDGDATSLVRKTDYASSSEAGVAKANYAYGVGSNSNNTLYAVSASDNEVKAGTNTYHQIAPLNQHRSVFYALAKAAGVNLASSTEETAPDGTNPGVYPAAAIQAILKMLLPVAPTTDGTYDLVCTVTNGEPTFSWVART